MNALRHFGQQLATALLWLPRWIDRAIHRFTQAVHAAVTDIRHAIVHDVDMAVSAMVQAVHATEDAMTRAVLGVWHAIMSLVRGFIDLFRQIGSDLKHLAVHSVHRLWHLLDQLQHGTLRLLWAATLPVRFIARPLVEPLRRRSALHARDAALGITTTPDHKAHWEWIALLIVVPTIAVLGLWYAGLVDPTASIALPRLDPQAILAKIVTFTPSQMTGLAAVVLTFGFLNLFWLHMLRDSYQRTYVSQTEKVKWRLVTTLFWVPGGVYYFFKVFNRWGLRQFFSYHLLSVMVTGVAMLVTTSTGGLVYYFNQKASADVAASNNYKIPNLEIDAKQKNLLLNRPRYGEPLTAKPSVGRTDPFAPLPSQIVQPTVTASPAPSSVLPPTPSPSPAPQP